MLKFVLAVNEWINDNQDVLVLVTCVVGFLSVWVIYY